MSSRLHSLAAILSYISAQGAENAEACSGGVTPPTGDLADAVSHFDSLPLGLREWWLAYAERVDNLAEL